MLREDFRIISDLFETDPSPDRWPIDPNSSLALDDTATWAFDPISSQFEGLAHAAMDNLHGVKSMIIDASAIHTFAEYAMVRAGIEAAAMGWWLLAPTTRRERCTRSLRMFWKDACDGSQALSGSNHADDYRERRRDHLLEVAKRNDIAPGDAMARIGTTKVLQELDHRHDLGALLVWRAASGMVHGRRWSTFALSDMEQDDSRRGPDMMHVKITGNTERLAMAYHIACLTLQEAMRLFHLRRSLPACSS